MHYAKLQALVRSPCANVAALLSGNCDSEQHK